MLLNFYYDNLGFDVAPGYLSQQRQLYSFLMDLKEIHKTSKKIFEHLKENYDCKKENNKYYFKIEI